MAGGGDGRQDRDPRPYNQKQSDCVMSFFSVELDMTHKLWWKLNVFSYSKSSTKWIVATLDSITCYSKIYISQMNTKLEGSFIVS